MDVHWVTWNPQPELKHLQECQASPVAFATMTGMMKISTDIKSELTCTLLYVKILRKLIS